MNEVYRFINGLDIRDKCVVAAVSGGPDSMFLLDILLNLKDKLNIKIVVVHLHHNLRKESDEEAIMVQKICKNNNIIFEFKKIEKYPDNKFSEEVARKIRYEFFDEVVKKYNSDILFTAHHGDDLIETILMRLTRGSSLKGYAGIKQISIDRGYKIVRPLLFLTKQEIEEYLNEKHIWYAVDMSNKDDAYTRNRYRNHILPELKKENNKVHYKFLEYSEKLLLVDEYLNKESNNFYNLYVSNNELNVLEFNKLDKIIKIYVLERILKEVYKHDITEISNKHIELIIDMLKEKNNSTIDLPLNKKGIIEYNKFKILDNKKCNYYEYTFIDEIKLENGKSIKIDNNTKETSNFVIHLNSSEIKLPFHVRCRKNGDVMSVKNMLGTKKVNDIFTDFKLPKELRDGYPIVTDSTGKIIWIPGIKKSQLDRKKEQKYDIILKYD